MTPSPPRPVWLPLAALALGLAGCASSGPATATPPGDRAASAEAAPDRADLEALYWQRQRDARADFTPADVAFMAGMIGHHAQALVMSRMAPTHGASPAVRRLAARIINAQQDEIESMQRWLRVRGQPVPTVEIDGLVLTVAMEDPAASGGATHSAMDHSAMDHGTAASGGEAHGGTDPGAGHGAAHDTAASGGTDHAAMGHSATGHSAMGHGAAGMDHASMPGMLTQAQLVELDRARGAAFDRLFLRYMIQHHGGAITMVDDLFAADGAASDTESFKLASDIHVDQETEIARMTLMLDEMTE